MTRALRLGVVLVLLSVRDRRAHVGSGGRRDPGRPPSARHLPEPRPGLLERVELDARQVQIVCAPAQHGSGRTLLDAGRRLWASWTSWARFYFARDTGYSPHFAMIGEAFGPFGLVALPVGSYTPREIARPVHMSPEEALQASRDLRAARFIGIHWGTFRLAREPYDEPPRRIAAEVARLELDPRTIWLPEPGDTLSW